MASAVTIDLAARAATATLVDRPEYVRAAALANDGTFRTRVLIAALHVAGVIYEQTQVLVAPTQLDKSRWLLAVKVALDPMSYVDTFAYLVASRSGIDATDSDDTIVAHLSDMWNIVANAPFDDVVSL